MVDEGVASLRPMANFTCRQHANDVNSIKRGTLVQQVDAGLDAPLCQGKW
jgi:hypothetical protein